MISNRFLTLEEAKKVIFDGEKITLDKKAILLLEKNSKFLKEFSKDKIIYGLNTGFGPMAKYKISEKEQIELQYNLIRSHCSGIGQKLSSLEVRAVMLSRLVSLMKGFSGIDSAIVELLVEFINKDIYPVIFEHGGVGASGDLVQLAHLALALIGEGEVEYKGKIISTREAMNQNKLSPIVIRSREGLALMNGTSCMTGLALINLIKAKNLLNWSIYSSSVLNEIFSAYDDYYSSELNSVKLHEGQQEVAKLMREILKSSKLMKKRKEYYYKDNPNVKKDKVQEYYSIRCTPQILGPILDTIKNAEKVIINEFNSVSDNPIINDKEKEVFHGGNFHGDYISLEMDKLKIVMTKISMLSERQLNLLLNDYLNGDLPPFLNMGKLGFNLGCQGLQFTATSTTAENQALSNPMYIHSIPTNADNQDIVSMGTNSAILAKKIIENSYEVLAIESIAILQAIDYSKLQDKLSTNSKKNYKKMREISPKFIEDTPKYKEIELLKKYLMLNNY